MFDTLKLSKALEGIGLDHAQAEMIVSGLYQSLAEHSGNRNYRAMVILGMTIICLK